MKKPVIIFFLLSIFGSAAAQDKLPSFGSIDKADLEMKDCDFEPGAEAVVLLDIGEMQYAYIHDTGWLLETEYRVRIKILKESALDRANVKIRYYNKGRMEDLTGLSGVTYNLDNQGNVTETKLERKEKYKKSIDEVRGETSFAMPDVRVGSVIEYRYKVSQHTFGYIPSWNFQQKIPVKYSAYRVVPPENFQYKVQTISRQPLEKVNTKSGGTWYIMRNIAGFKKEPMSAGASNYLQGIEFQLAKIDVPGYFYESTWPKIIERLLVDEDFGDILKMNVSMGNELAAVLNGVTSEKEKIHIIYNYVQSNMLWNEDYALGPDNSFAFFDAWDKKLGSIADINFMLIKLLQKAGIDAKPLLVSTKENGAININYPSLHQFDAVMVYVKDGDQRYVMNAADKFNPFYLVPYDVVYTNALVVDKQNGGLVGLNNDKKFQNDIFFTTYVDADGGITGNATLTSYNYARNIRVNTYKKNKLKELLEDNEGIKIQVDSISVKNGNDEMKPFLQEIQFSGNIQASGGYYFLPFGLFSGLGKNPFLDENRITDIDFNYPKKYVISGSYFLTDDFIVNDLPKNKKMLMPDSSIELTRMVQKENNIISFKFTLDFNSPAYVAESYPLIKDFFKKMYAILDERIVLKKK
jgi:Domain of Unknown Function with PDB structure (DUF3857)